MSEVIAGKLSGLEYITTDSLIKAFPRIFKSIGRKVLRKLLGVKKNQLAKHFFYSHKRTISRKFFFFFL